MEQQIIPIAAEYLEYLGTKNKSSEDVAKAFYELASSFSVSAGNEETYVSLDGLNENFDKSVTLLEDLIRNCQPDEEALSAYKERLKKSRQNAKENKGAIMAGLRSYAQYGAQNPFNNVLSDEELDALTAKQLVDIIHQMVNYKHRILYYGPKTVPQLQVVLAKAHPSPKAFAAAPSSKTFTQTSVSANNVLFAPYDMTQAEVFWLRNADAYDLNSTPTSALFNNYFGGGMGSIVFQTIRESKALAYSTYAYFSNPAKKTDRSVVMAYVGTQADKFKEATAGMNELLNDLPESKVAFDNAKQSLTKSLASERIMQDRILFSYLAAQKLGNTTDTRKLIFDRAPSITFADIKKFHDKELANKPYTYCIVGKDENLPNEELKHIGTVKRLSLKEIFGY